MARPAYRAAPDIGHRDSVDRRSRSHTVDRRRWLARTTERVASDLRRPGPHACRGLVDVLPTRGPAAHPARSRVAWRLLLRRSAPKRSLADRTHPVQADVAYRA